MDKLAKAIIEYMNSCLTNNNDCWCSVSTEWNNESELSIDTLSSAVNASIPDVQAAIKYLCEKNIAEYRYLKSRFGKVAIAFHLKHAGRHFNEISSLTTKEKWKERCIGAAVTLAIWGLQELIQHYLPI